MKDSARASATRADKLREQLRRRQERNAQRAVKGVENLSDTERKQATAISNLMTDADRSREDNALLDALRALEEEEARKAQLAALRDAMKNASADDRRRALAEHEEHLFRMQQRLHGDKQASRDALLAKLAARKRVKEETLSDKIVADELARIQQQEVT